MEEVRQLTQEEREALQEVLRDNAQKMQQAREMMEASVAYTGAGDHVRALQCSAEARRLASIVSAVSATIDKLYAGTNYNDIVLTYYI